MEDHRQMGTDLSGDGSQDPGRHALGRTSGDHAIDVLPQHDRSVRAVGQAGRLRGQGTRQDEDVPGPKSFAAVRRRDPSGERRSV